MHVSMASMIVQKHENMVQAERTISRTTIRPPFGRGITILPRDSLADLCEIKVPQSPKFTLKSSNITVVIDSHK